MITSAADDFKSRIRSLLNVNGVNDVPEHLKFLNKVSVKNPDDINVLSTLVAFDSERQLVVEAGLQQNSIQLYSLFDDFARTIIIGKHLMSIEQLAAERDDLIRDQYVHINAYDSYFAALYYDATEEEQYKEEKLPRLQFSLGTEIQSVNCWCLSLLHRLTLIIQKERCIFGPYIRVYQRMSLARLLNLGITNRIP